MIKLLLMTTFTGSIASLFLMLFKERLIKILGGTYYYYICIIVLLLFILPLKNNAPQFVRSQPLVANKDIELEHKFISQDKSKASSVQETLSFYKEPVISIRKTMDIKKIVLIIWFVGFILMLFRYLFGYFKFKDKLIQSSPVDRIENLNIVLSSYTNSPILIGFFKPTIVIPSFKINKKDYKLALLHELMHHKQKDAWIKLFTVFINSIHWFNPITYFYMNTISEACEYSCDEKVIKNIRSEERNYYGHMILNFISLSSSDLSNNFSKNKHQLYRRIELIMKTSRTNRKTKKIFGVLLTSTLISTSVLATSFAFADQLKPLSEYHGAIKTYYNIHKDLENNVRDILRINTNQVVYVDQGITYIDSNGRKIDTFNRTKPHYGVQWQWVDKGSINEDLVFKTMLIEGKEVKLAFSNDISSYKDDKVIKKMIENQITYELSYKNKTYNYNHGAFINELINRAVYVVKDVITPDNFKAHQFQSSKGDIETLKLLTDFDKKDKISNIFNEKVLVPKNIDGNQGKQIGDNFIIKEGETLAIDLKETTDKMPKINIAIINENTKQLAFMIPNVTGGYRLTFKPGKNNVNNSFKVVVSGSESDTASIDVFTY